MNARLQHLIDYLDRQGHLPEHSFTFPDGDTWHATGYGPEAAVVHQCQPAPAQPTCPVRITSASGSLKGAQLADHLLSEGEITPTQHQRMVKFNPCPECGSKLEEDMTCRFCGFEEYGRLDKHRLMC
jgi:hypothetical protein